MKFVSTLAVALGASVFAVFGAAAQEPAPAGKALSLELNSLSQADKTCRVYMIARNDMGVKIDDMSVQIVLFDQEQHVTNFLTLKSGPLTVGKSRLMQFNLDNVDCASVSGILVNDITDCTGEGLTPAACLDALHTSSKASIELNL